MRRPLKRCRTLLLHFLVKGCMCVQVCACFSFHPSRTNARRLPALVRARFVSLGHYYALYVSSIRVPTRSMRLRMSASNFRICAVFLIETCRHVQCALFPKQSYPLFCSPSLILCTRTIAHPRLSALWALGGTAAAVGGGSYFIVCTLSSPLYPIHIHIHYKQAFRIGPGSVPLCGCRCRRPGLGGATARDFSHPHAQGGTRRNSSGIRWRRGTGFGVLEDSPAVCPRSGCLGHCGRAGYDSDHAEDTGVGSVQARQRGYGRVRACVCVCVRVCVCVCVCVLVRAFNFWGFRG